MLAYEADSWHSTHQSVNRNRVDRQPGLHPSEREGWTLGIGQFLVVGRVFLDRQNATDIGPWITETNSRGGSLHASANVNGKAWRLRRPRRIAIEYICSRV